MSYTIALRKKPKLFITIRSKHKVDNCYANKFLFINFFKKVSKFNSALQLFYTCTLTLKSNNQFIERNCQYRLNYIQVHACYKT